MYYFYFLNNSQKFAIWRKRKSIFGRQKCRKRDWLVAHFFFIFTTHTMYVWLRQIFPPLPNFSLGSLSQNLSLPTSLIHLVMTNIHAKIAHRIPNDAGSTMKSRRQTFLMNISISSKNYLTFYRYYMAKIKFTNVFLTFWKRSRSPKLN